MASERRPKFSSYPAINPSATYEARRSFTHNGEAIAAGDLIEIDGERFTAAQVTKYLNARLVRITDDGGATAIRRPTHKDLAAVDAQARAKRRPSRDAPDSGVEPTDDGQQLTDHDGVEPDDRSGDQGAPTGTPSAAAGRGAATSAPGSIEGGTASSEPPSLDEAASSDVSSGEAGQDDAPRASVSHTPILQDDAGESTEVAADSSQNATVANVPVDLDTLSRGDMLALAAERGIDVPQSGNARTIRAALRAVI